jgi:Tol biopolymer transport system component
MKTNKNTLAILAAPILIFSCLSLLFVGCLSESKVPHFTESTDVGTVKLKGSANFDPLWKQYKITGSGSNMWYRKDAFHFLYRQIHGDVALTTDVKLLGTGQNDHRKAGPIIRQNLSEDSPYVDVVVHGDGMISLQYRKTFGADTQEIQSATKAPASIRLLRNGDVFTAYTAKGAGQFKPIGSVSVKLTDPVYAGLAVCSHDDTQIETAVFSNVNLKNPGVIKMQDRIIESTLEIISIETGQRRFVHRSRQHFEAPNWSRDGKYLLFNSNGKLYTINLNFRSKPKLLNTGQADKCNNDHGFSPDGKFLAISHAPKDKSLIYIVPAKDGQPRLITENGPSYWHGWSPDGKTLAYCAERNGEYDVYTIPVEGGSETRLTNAPGLDDGPDYSPDGKYIFFNSDRTGLMKIWRMNSDGSEQTQITFDDDYCDWFPHPSPDGKWLVFLSYDKSVQGHPPNKDVTLRIMPLTGSKPKILAHLFGGQGTINVPSWSPDSKNIAFVSYQLVAPEKE